MSFASEPELQINPESTEKRLINVESSIDALKLQIAATTVPQHLEKSKNTLFSIIHLLEPDGKEKEGAILLFVHRVVELSINILIWVEAMKDLPHMAIERFHQVLEDAKTFIVSVNQWKPYPWSMDAFRKLLATKSRIVEDQIVSIFDELETSLSYRQIKPPVSESSSQSCKSASSNLFSNASNLTVNNSQFYCVPGGSVHFVSNSTEDNESTAHPDFLGLPHYEDLELEKELYKGDEYRLHLGRSRGRAVAVKVFQGPYAKELCLKTAQFNRSVMHPNILRMIGGPNRNAASSFLVFDGDYQGTVESRLPIVLKEGIKEAFVIGANTVIACSLGLDYLDEIGLPFPIMEPSHFVLMLSKQGRIVLNFDADATWDYAAHIQNPDHSEISQSDNATEICNELIQRTFYASCKEFYQDQRIYADDSDDADQTHLGNEDEDDQPEGESEIHLPGGLDVSLHDSLSWKSPRKAKGHRRELVWKPELGTSFSLEETGHKYQASLARFRSEDVLVHRQGYSVKQLAHRCPGYKRTEIVLTQDIEHSGIVSHTSPVPNEICAVCGEKVKIEEIFDCLCGLPENHADNSQPTIQCVICNRWQHQECMKISPDMQTTNFICWRCPGSSFVIDAMKPSGSLVLSSFPPNDLGSHFGDSRHSDLASNHPGTVSGQPLQQPDQHQQSTKAQGKIVWKGALNWSGTSAQGKKDMRAVVVAIHANHNKCHSETWPLEMSLALVHEVSAPDGELTEWIRRHAGQVAICTFIAPNNPVLNERGNDNNFASLISLLVEKKIYATAAWTTPSGVKSQNALIFPMEGKLVGAFFPLTGLPNNLPMTPNMHARFLQQLRGLAQHTQAANKFSQSRAGMPSQQQLLSSLRRTGMNNNPVLNNTSLAMLESFVQRNDSGTILNPRN